jgi:hypothetical protein
MSRILREVRDSDFAGVRLCFGGVVRFLVGEGGLLCGAGFSERTCCRALLDDANCLGTCTPTSAGVFASGLGISCVNSSTSATCSTSNPNWLGGLLFAPISAESKSLSPAKWSGLSSVTGSLVLAKVKYRLKAASNQAAGEYTNIVSWIVVPVY